MLIVLYKDCFMKNYKKEFESLTLDTLKDVYVLYGSEKHSLKSAANALIDTVSKFSPMGVDKIFPDKFETLELLSELENTLFTPSFFGDKKIVYIKDFPINELKSKEFSSFMMMLEQINGNACLILSFPCTCDKVDKNFKKMLESLPNSSLKAEFSSFSSQDLIKYCIQYAKKFDKEFKLDAATLLVERSKQDLRTLINECDKLINYDSDVIDADLVSIFTKPTLETNVFKITEMLFAKRFDECILMLNELLKEKEDPIAILGVISSSYVDLLRLKLCSYDDNAIANAFDYGKRAFVLSKNKFVAKSINMKTLKKSIKAIVEADKKLKFSSENKELTMYFLLFELIGFLLENEN